MTRALVIALAYVEVLTLGTEPAAAQGRAWCLYTSGPPTSCGFYTLEQCLASRGAGSSHCAPNPATTWDRSPADGSQSVGRERRR
jgi:uncharacterized protein DUF3551